MRRARNSISIPMLPLIKREQTNIKGQMRYQPTVPVRLKRESIMLEEYALIDTGADYCVLNEKLIEKLQITSISIDQKEVIVSGIGDVRRFDIYYFDLYICDVKFQEITNMGFVRFLATPLPSGINIILGQNGFIENISDLNINYLKKRTNIVFRKEIGTQLYLKEAESLIEAGNYAAAIYYIGNAIELLLSNIIKGYQESLSLPADDRPINVFSINMQNNIAQIPGMNASSLKLLKEFINIRNETVHSHGMEQERDIASQAKRTLIISRNIIDMLSNIIKNQIRFDDYTNHSNY